MVFSVGDFSTYDTIGSAKQKQGKFVHLIAKLDKTQPIEYDAINNPNYLSFMRLTALGEKQKLFITTANQLTWKKVKELC